MKKILLIFMLFFAILYGFSSCYSVQTVADTITIESGEIPPDMAVEDFILIGVLKERASYDKWLIRDFNNYTGKYILLTQKEIDSNEAYSDVSVYRYIMDYDSETIESTVYRSPSSRQYGDTDFYDKNFIRDTYYIIDRKDNGKKYVRKSGSGYFSKEIKAYLIAIEKHRLK